MKNCFGLLAFTLATAVAGGGASATTIADPANDFLATYTGAHNGDLDIVGASASFDGTNFLLGATTNGAIGASTGSLFVWGVNRGAGTARLTGSPSVGIDVLFDAVIVMLPDGTLRVVSFPTAGPPTISQFANALTISGNSISGAVSLSLLPSTGYSTENYMFTLWSRLRVNPSADGTNDEIADFAPDIGGIRASVPEPASWALMITGLGAVGWASRRKARPAAPAPVPA